ncbi:MAG TPA: type VI secretion system contractile sheath large subunit, partial [Pusillimonas sp.]|nr:type VI secretion system contractile sheath large subunit [Pusillimonas sp.]
MSEEQAKQDNAAAPSEGGSLIDQLLETTKVRPGDESYAITKQGIQTFISSLLDPSRTTDRITASLADDMIAELDKKLCAQVNEILHHPEFQRLESSWRSLKFLIDRTNFRENIKIQIMNVNKDDLLSDFEDSPEVTKSGLYKNCYTAEFGQFGGQPFGAIIANYEFGPGSSDVKLLQYCASVASMSHAPFIAAAGAQFFGLEDFSKLPDLKDLSSIFEMPQYTKWN